MGVARAVPVGRVRGGIVNSTLDLYHRTSADAARAIVAAGRLTTRENTPHAYASTSLTGQGECYGPVAVHVRVNAAEALLDDEFPDGERHYRIPLDRCEILGIVS